MNKKVSLILLLGLLVFSVSTAAADTQPLSLAIGFEEALNLGDPNATAGLFAEDAVLISRTGGEAIVGRDAIRDTLALQSDPDRSFEIVGVQMTGNQLMLVVDISDHGITWGRQTLRTVVEDGRIQHMETVAFRILL